MLQVCHNADGAPKRDRMSEILTLRSIVMSGKYMETYKKIFTRAVDLLALGKDNVRIKTTNKNPKSCGLAFLKGQSCKEAGQKEKKKG